MANRKSIQKKLFWDIYAALGPKLKSLGFEPKRAGVYVLPIGPDVTGWLLLGTVEAIHGAGIFPKLELSFQSIERLRAAIDGREQNPDQRTFGRPLHTLMPNRKENNTWVFTPEGDKDFLIDDLITAIRVHGVPYLKSFYDLYSLRQYL